MECYKLSAALQPGLQSAWLRLGNACRDAGMYKKAVLAFSRALALTDKCLGDVSDEALCGFVYCKQVSLTERSNRSDEKGGL
jgi:tetratricopeptide (TPR) repeat protein